MSGASISQPLSCDCPVPLQKIGRSQKGEKRRSKEGQAKKQDVPFGKVPEDRPSEGLPVDDKDDDGSDHQSKGDPHQDAPENDQDGLKEEHEDLFPVEESQGAVEGKLPAPFVEKKDEGVRDPEDGDHDGDGQERIGDREGLMEDLKDPGPKSVLGAYQKVDIGRKGAREPGDEVIGLVRVPEKDRKVRGSRTSLLGKEISIGKKQDSFDRRIIPIDAQDFFCEGSLPGGVGHRIADPFSEAAGKGLRNEDAFSLLERLHHLGGGGAVHKRKGRLLVKAMEIGIGQIGGLSFDRSHEQGVAGDPKNPRLLVNLTIKGVGERLRAVGGEAGGRLDVDVGRQVLVDPEVERLFKGGDHDHDSHDHAEAGHDPRDRDSRPARGGRKGREGE